MATIAATITKLPPKPTQADVIRALEVIADAGLYVSGADVARMIVETSEWEALKDATEWDEPWKRFDRVECHVEDVGKFQEALLDAYIERAYGRIPRNNDEIVEVLVEYFGIEQVGDRLVDRNGKTRYLWGLSHRWNWDLFPVTTDEDQIRDAFKRRFNM